ncbi:hypothetical protein [Paludisphaera mucosa]|uniref:Zinc finger/thioredoxin putative domain-containing protein n=1 Tax=Paludisphaera mucosa TaxID=3030827 RepID=A0ABT6FKR6_9BACT|nr:hypothetical protein [Paludisphaera mucosa]MDG3008161.1 hypothetical protein [Paludisphaera mucosa]
MAVKLTCPTCGKVLTPSVDVSGKKVRCGGCGETFRVPATAAATTPAEPSAPPKAARPPQPKPPAAPREEPVAPRPKPDSEFELAAVPEEVLPPRPRPTPRPKVEPTPEPESEGPNWKKIAGSSLAGLLAVYMIYVGVASTYKIYKRSNRDGDSATNLAPEYGSRSDQSPELPYTSPDGAYRVGFPETPNTTETTQETPVGPQKLSTAMLAKGRITRAVSWSQFPPQLLEQHGRNPHAADAILDGGLKSAASMGWTVLKQEPIALGPHTGREVQIRVDATDGGGPGLGLIRFFLIGDRLYQVLMIGPEGTVKPEEQRAFVGSFQLISPVPVLVSRESAGPVGGSGPKGPGAAYESPDGAYKVAFPEPPKTNEWPQKSIVGDVTLHTATFDKGGIARMVAWAQFPEQALREKRLSELLDQAVQFGGPVSRRQENVNAIEMGRHPGREIEFQDLPYAGAIRVLIAGDRLYHIRMTGRASDMGPDDAKAFVRSFELVKDFPAIVSHDPGRSAAEIVAAAPPTSPAARPARIPPRPRDDSAPPARSAGGASVAEFVFVDDDKDKVGENGGEAGRPNGRNDLQFRVALELPPDATVDELSVSSSDGNHRWVTQPNDRFWFLGVERAGTPAISGYVDKVGTFSGSQAFDLFAQGDLGPGAVFVFQAALTIGGQPVEIGAECTRPRPESKSGAVAAGTSSGGASLVSVRWLSDVEDRVGANGQDAGKSNGETDQRLKIEAELPDQTTIDNVVVSVRDSINHWESRPSDRFWTVAVYRGDDAVSTAHVEPVGTFSGRQAFDLYVNGGFGVRSGSLFDVELELSIAGAKHAVKGTCERP